MIAGLETDFEMTLGDLYKTAWENNDFVSKVSIHQKYINLTKSGERLSAILAILFIV